MNKFKIGDKVKVIRTGKFGVIDNISYDDFDREGCSDNCYHIYNRYYTVHDLELVQEILTEEEKEYLSNIIKPFRNEISYIKKIFNTITTQQQYIFIRFKNNDLILFPDFKAGQYYKNMKLKRKYTLEELGL